MVIQNYTMTATTGDANCNGLMLPFSEIFRWNVWYQYIGTGVPGFLIYLGRMRVPNKQKKKKKRYQTVYENERSEHD